MQMGWVVLLVYCFMIPPTGSVREARALDALLHMCAYTSFGAGSGARTGVAYQLQLPGGSDLGGIKAAAMRLRSGSLRKRGLTATFGEFQLPPAIHVHPPVEHLLLVYHNLGNSSPAYYPLPPNYVYLSPVLALLAYEYHAPNFTNLPPELNITASLHHPISITFPNDLRKSLPHGWVPKCLCLYSSGQRNFTTFFSNSTCAISQQGHFSVVAHSPDPEPDPVGVGVGGNNKRRMRIRWFIPAMGGGALLMLLCWLAKRKRKRRMDVMERAAECGETLHMTKVGTTKAPAAPFTRTLPTIESEYHLSYNSIT